MLTDLEDIGAFELWSVEENDEITDFGRKRWGKSDTKKDTESHATNRSIKGTSR